MVWLITIILMLDAFSKIIIMSNYMLEKEYPVIKNFFYISYVKNTGAAWSLFNNKKWLIIMVSAVVIMWIILYILKNKPATKIEKIAYSFILGGALGNFIGRVIYGYVVDFISIKIFGYNYPVFNFADVFIVLGVFMLIIYTWRCSSGTKSNIK